MARKHRAQATEPSHDSSIASDHEDVIISKRGKTESKPSYACSGHIICIELIDFMCHRHLLVTLNPHINFVVGNNGSGKSAILTALTVCLGGRASATQRATSVDSLIREGATSGKVKVKLSNEEDNPYMQDTYGRSITIERCFRREGANSYSIYAENGRLVEGRKEKVTAICDHFGIQVDNPLAILTQETAKKFLANAKPKELYEFFMKATQLEQMSVDYAFAIDKSLEPMRERILGLEKQVSDLERLKEAHQIIQQLRGELTWAMIEQREKVQDKLLILTIVQEYEQLLAGLDMRRNSVIGMQERISDGKASYEKLEAQIQDMEKSISEEQSRVESLMAHKNQVASQIRDKDHILNELKIDATSINVEFGSLKAQLEELNAKMQAELHTTSDKRQVKLRSRLSEIDVEQVRLSQQLCDSQDLEKQLTVQIGENEDIKCKMVEKLQETRQKALDYGERIKLIQSRMGNRVRAFGERMPEALAEIKRNKRSFGKNPVGPIGLVVGVKDRRWTLPLEAIIARNLDAFIVNDHQDRTLVQNILKKYGLSNPVIVLKFDGKLDISSGKPDSRYLTALDVLEINDPVVLKALVILCQIERQVLISDRQEAMGVIKSRPRSVDAVYTQAVRMNAGQKSVSASHLYKNPNVSGLAHDYEDALSEETKRLEQAAREQKVLGVELSKSEEKLGNLRTLLEEATQNINLTEQNLLRTNREARDLQLELRGSESISQSLYEQERTDMEQKMAAMEAQFQANEDQSSRIIDEHKTLTQRLQEFDTEITLIKTHHEEVLEEISNTIRTRKAVEREISNFENNIRLESHIISSKEDMLRQSSNELEEMRMSALQVCPRVHVSRTVQELDKELTANEECLRQNQNPNLDPLKIRQDLGDTRIQHRDAQKSIAVNERLVKSLRMALEQRQRAWEEFRRSVSKMSSSEFIFMLHSRGFQGSLEYKHHAGELEIKVIPQGQQSATMQSIQEPPKSGGKRKKVDPPTDTSENRDIKQLSGGEKSYSTACFLFSLWQAMGSPLRCLDEFDVYMVTWIDLVDIC